MRTRDSQGGRGRGPRKPGRDGRPRQGRSRDERPAGGIAGKPAGKATGKATGKAAGKPTGKPAGKRLRPHSPAKRGRAGEGAQERGPRRPPSWWKMPALADVPPDVPEPPSKRPVERPRPPQAPPQGDWRLRKPPEPEPPPQPFRPVPPPPPPRPPAGARLAKVEELEVQIEKLVAGGEGLARWEGVPIFVPRSAPGDRLRVRIVERRPDYGRAEIVEILEPGPARRPDPYPELSPTGICDLQHIRDEVQPLLKAAAVRETLERLGGIQVVPENTELIAGAPWGYRLRTQLHTEVDPMTGGAQVGYYARGSKDLVAVTRCALLVPELDALLPELPGRLGREAPRRIDLAAGDGEITVSPAVPGLHHGEVSLRVGENTYFYDARTFFQGHRELLPRLVEAVVGRWEGELAFDLYGGVGLFALPLARRYRRVVTVEGDTQSARFARSNARRNKLSNVEVVARAVESWVDELPEGVDRVVLDPPRGGLSPKVPLALLEKRPKRLTYLSCHPATLARDLRLLTKAYRVESIALIDLFPQTGHMEALVQMALK